MKKKTKVKICCISSIEEAQLALDCGADALGLVSEMPSGPGVIPRPLIKAISTKFLPKSNTFLLTSKQDINSIIEQYHDLKPRTIQIVDALEDGTLQELKATIPEAQLVQVIHVIDESTIEEAMLKSKFADALLLDSGNPKQKVKTLGGTGKTHNWEISKRIVELVDKPVWLAGGLNASNVRQAIEKVQPYGVDLCSSVRTNGSLDKIKLQNFIKATYS